MSQVRIRAPSPSPSGRGRLTRCPGAFWVLTYIFSTPRYKHMNTMLGISTLQIMKLRPTVAISRKATQPPRRRPKIQTIVYLTRNWEFRMTVWWLFLASIPQSTSFGRKRFQQEQILASPTNAQGQGEGLLELQQGHRAWRLAGLSRQL